MLKLAQILHLRIAAVAPIIGVTIGDPDDKVTWIVDYLPEATTEQRSAAQQIIDQFDLAAATAESHAEALRVLIIDAEDHALALTTYPNPNNLSELIVGCRLAALDPYARVVAHPDPVDGVAYVTVRSSLTNQQITDELAPPQTAEETAALADFANSIASFNAIPDWATLPVSELISAANAGFFNGEDETVVRNRIDTQVTTNIVTVRGALKDIVAELYKAHGREIKIIQSVGYLRDYLIRLRRQASGQLSPTRD